MYEWHHGSPEELGEQQPFSGHRAVSTGQRLQPQTLLTPWLKLLRSDSLENNSPGGALFLCSPAVLCIYVHHGVLFLHSLYQVQPAPGQSWLPRLGTAWAHPCTAHTQIQHFWDQGLHQQVHTTELIYSTCLWSSVCTKSPTFLWKKYLFS